MKQAIALVSFHDLREGVLRQAGDAFLCDDERGEYLVGLNFVRLNDAPKEKPKRARKTKK